MIHNTSLEPSDYAKFIEIDSFLGDWSRLGLTDRDLHALQIGILLNPLGGAVVKGSHGLRKLRYRKIGSSKGKSGSFRVFYSYFFDYDVVLLIAVLGKGEKEDLEPSAVQGIAAIPPAHRQVFETGSAAVSEDKREDGLGSKILAGLSAFCDALDAGEPIGKRFTVRSVSLDLKVKPYGPDDVKRVRTMLNASQPLLARFLGVSVKTLRSWEQGARPVPTIACRYLDDIVANPEIWTNRLRLSNTGDAG